MNSFLKHKDFFWHYETFGTGNEILFAFHGFDKSCRDFKVFESSLGKKYKIVSVDLFYHGASSCPQEGTRFSTVDLKNMLQQYLSENKIKKFSLLGYSLGGKIVLALLELFPTQIKTVYLFAPFGVKNNLFYLQLRKHKIVEQINKYIMIYPTWLFSLLSFLKNTRLLNKRMCIVLRHQLKTKERRKKLYEVYNIFKEINSNIHNVQSIINKNNINLQLFYGKYDPIEPVSRGQYFVKGLKNKEVLHVIPTGHLLINEKMHEMLLVIK